MLPNVWYRLEGARVDIGPDWRWASLEPRAVEKGKTLSPEKWTMESTAIRPPIKNGSPGLFGFSAAGDAGIYR